MVTHELPKARVGVASKPNEVSGLAPITRSCNRDGAPALGDPVDEALERSLDLVSLQRPNFLDDRDELVEGISKQLPCGAIRTGRFRPKQKKL